MIMVLTALLAVLKFLGGVLLFLLALLVILLLLPVELRFSYFPNSLSLTAWYGPLHFRLWPRDSSARSPAQPTAVSPPTVTVQPAAEPAHPANVSPAAAEVSAGVTVPAQSHIETSAFPESASAAEPSETPKKSGGLPFHIAERIETATHLLTHDPAAFARCMFGHLRWVGRFLAHHIKVRHLTVFWTVTGEDAAQTATLYGTGMTAANNLLVFLQQIICLQCDHLQLEPDFTGQRKGERKISGRLHTHPFLLLWLLIRLLFRLGKDPQLQPAHN